MKGASYIRNLFERFLAGTSTQEQMVELFEYFGTGDETELRTLILQSMHDGEPDTDQVDEDLQARLDAVYEVTGRRIMNDIPLREPVRRNMPFWRYAAASVVLCGLCWLAFWYSSERRLPAKVAVITRYEHRKIDLPDGSKIWLAPQSRLSYPERFESNRRLISLTGEAFFEVSRDENRPFFVRSGEITTRVLGTSFNIQAYEKDSSVSVTVLTGKVSVSASREPALNLTPFQRAEYRVGTKNLQLRDYPEAPEFLNRRAGNLKYEGQTIPEVIRDIQRIYPLPIVLKGDFTKSVFYGEKKARDNVPDFLRNVCRVNNLTFRMQNDTITIEGASYRK